MRHVGRQLAAIERDGAVRPLLGRGRIDPARDMRRTPKLAAPAHERLAVRRNHPGLGRLVIDRRAGRKIALKPRDGEVPTDADRARTELFPVVLDDRGVLQRHPRLAALRRKPDVDPAHRAAELPGRREMTSEARMP